MLQISAQQVQRQKVIVEVGTGTWCSACPAVVAIIHDLEIAGANIAVIEYHISDSYENADASTRETYYAFPWYPTTYYDANHIGYDDWATYSVHLSNYEARNDLLSSFSLTISEGEIDNLVVNGSVLAEKLAAYSGGNLVLHIALTESNIPENWQGETELDYVERLMFPNGNGTPLDFSTQDEQNIPFSFNLDPSWVITNCELTYFIQDNDTKEILQGNKISLDEMASLTTSNNTLQDSETFIFPNPTDDFLFIQSNTRKDISMVELFDAMGRLVYTEVVYNSEIDLSNFPTGIYTLSYKHGQAKITKKVIKI